MIVEPAIDRRPRKLETRRAAASITASNLSATALRSKESRHIPRADLAFSPQGGRLLGDCVGLCRAALSVAKD
jgi:hypothetical protein